jgi:hypothetical protein
MIPKQIAQYPLIKVCRPSCKIESHGDCNSPGKRPVRSVDEDRPISEIRQWVRQGGNYGVVARSEDRLVILDSDSEGFAQLVRGMLPDTFTVKTGSGNYHFYYRSDYSGNQSFGQGDSELGSIRTDNYQAVGPNSVHPDTGQEYTVYRDNPVNPVPESQVRDFAEKVRSTDFDCEDGAAAATGGGGGGGSSQSVSTASELSVNPTDRTLSALEFIRLDPKREAIAKVFDHHHPPRHIRVWACGFLYSACGLTQNQIERVLRECADWATDTGRIRTEVRSLVRTSCNSQRASEKIDLDRYLGPADMDDNTSERRKTVESGEGRTLRRGDNNMSSNNFDYTSKESLTVYNADSAEDAEDGDRVVRAEVTNMQGHDENGEVDTDFVTISKGTLRDNGEFGVSPEYPSDNKSVGSADPDDLRLIAEALEQIADQLDD